MSSPGVDSNPARWRVAAWAWALAITPAMAQVTLYENDGYSGRSVTARYTQPNLSASGFNDRASSAIVTRDRWEVCDDANFEGRCRVLRQGNYPSLSAMGLNDRISSVRQVSAHVRVDEDRYGPPPTVAQDFRRRGAERLFEAKVTSAHAVMGQPEQRCWIEREQVGGDRRDDSNAAAVPGALIGAVIGGILGHQVGGGTGRDLATIGGAVGGGVLGAKVGKDVQRNNPPESGRDMQRCAPVAGSDRPAYWDVTYTFRGKNHHVQLTREPGDTVTVNVQGEPRA